MIYELINYSDPYTLESDDEAAVCLATLLLGSGKYGLRDPNGDTVMPILFFGGHDEWCLARYGKTVDVLLNSTDKTKIIMALDSVLLGEDREISLRMSEKQRDRLRTSLNNIGAYAKSLVKAISNESRT